MSNNQHERHEVNEEKNFMLFMYFMVKTTKTASGAKMRLLPDITCFTGVLIKREVTG